MIRHNAARTVAIAAAFLMIVAGSAIDLGAIPTEARVAISTGSLSESAVLLLFGSSLWAVAMLRRQWGHSQRA